VHQVGDQTKVKMNKTFWKEQITCVSQDF